jgi:hypothetical protein
MDFDLANISIVLGICSYCGIVIIYWLIASKIADKKKFFFPFTALALSLNYDFAVWATSGLETSFFTLLLSLTFFLFFYTNLSKERKLLITGLLLALSCMTRPDAVIFFLYANSLLIFSGIINRSAFKKLLKELLYLNSAFLFAFVPYLIWKFSYYGDIFPNTYYAKSAGDSYLEQGFYYIWLFLSSYRSTLISLAGVAVLIKLLVSRKKQNLTETLRENESLMPMFAALGAAIIYLLFFVARVGGDFMFARFIIPVLPFLYFSIEVSAGYFLKKNQKYLVLVFALILAIIVYEKNLRDDLFQANDNGKIIRKNSTETSRITDERFYYLSYWEQFPRSKNLAEALITTGKSLNPYFKDLDITVVIGGARNYIGYFAEFSNIIIDNGLTDKYIARLPLTERSRIGHEKYAPLDYLLKRKAVLGFYDSFRNDVNQKPYAVAYIRIKELGIKLVVEIIYYDNKIIKSLKERLGENFIYTDMDIYLNEYLSNNMKTRSVEQVEFDYKYLKEFYFDFNPDSREKIIKDYITK